MTAEQERMMRIVRIFEVALTQVQAIVTETGLKSDSSPLPNDAYDLKFSEKGRELEKDGL